MPVKSQDYRFKQRQSATLATKRLMKSAAVRCLWDQDWDCSKIVELVFTSDRKEQLSVPVCPWQCKKQKGQWSTNGGALTLNCLSDIYQHVKKTKQWKALQEINLVISRSWMSCTKMVMFKSNQILNCYKEGYRRVSHTVVCTVDRGQTCLFLTLLKAKQCWSYHKSDVSQHVIYI